MFSVIGLWPIHTRGATLIVFLVSPDASPDIGNALTTPV
jgi:hypothetical protein